MTQKRDRGGNLVTDYSKSNIAPERARKLNAAELDYVNGIWNEATEEITWPSYPQLAEKYDLPTFVISEQAGKHRWSSRREQRKTAMITFKNEQTRKRWLEEDRNIMGVILHNIEQSVATISRLQDEHRRMIDKALREEHERRVQGEPNPIVRVGIRISEAEALARANETVMKTAEKLAARITALQAAPQEIAPPQLIKTVEQEEAERVVEQEKSMPQATVLDIVKEIRAIEEARARHPKVISGELEYDDDEDDVEAVNE